MRKYLCCMVFLCIPLLMQAQDVLITKEGDVIKVYGLEVSPAAVFYRESDAADAPIQRKDKADLLMIKYQDGRKEIVGNDHLPADDLQARAGNEAQKPSAEDKAANELALQKWQAPIPDYQGKKKDGKPVKPSILYSVLRPTNDSQIADANLELSFKGGPIEGEWGDIVESKFIVTVKNKTRSTIYLDLGNTFFVRGEISYPYFVPTASSITDGTNSSVGVNMGAVAGAVGLGGSLGKLANGINVGQGKSKYNTTVTYSQRIMALSPMSSRELDAVVIIPLNTNDFGSQLTMKTMKHFMSHEDRHIHHPCLEGVPTPDDLFVSMEYQESDIPMRIRSFVTYSFKEDMETPRTLFASFFVRKVFGIPGKRGRRDVDSRYLSGQQMNDVFVILWKDDEE